MKSLPLSLPLASALLVACATTPTPTQTRVPDVAQAISPEPGIVSAGRLTADDIALLREAGIRQVIDFTPDEETPGFDEATAVRAAGIAYANLPLRGAQDLTPANVRLYDELLRTSERPLLVHCASGNRVGAIAALHAAWLEGRTAEDAIAIGRAWGLKGLEEEVRRRLAESTAAGQVHEP